MSYKKPIAERNYNFSDGVLEQLADVIKANITRDQAALASRGITPATIANLQSLIDNMKNIATDVDARGSVTVAVEDKNIARLAVMNEARRLRTAAQNTFGVGTGKYNRFGFDGMDKLRDDEVVRYMKSAYRVGQDLQSDLADEGIDAAFFTGFETAINNYDTALDDVNIAEGNRDKLTENRVSAGNTLYKEIVRLCNTGKDYFASVSEATYNDYVIENFLTNSGNTVLAVFEDFISPGGLVNLGALPVAGKIIRFTVLAGGPLEFGLSVDGSNFDGNTSTVGSVGSTTILISELASAGTLILVRNQSAGLQGQYKLEVLG